MGPSRKSMNKFLVFDFAGVLFQWSPPRLLLRELPELGGDEKRAQALVPDFFQGYEGEWAEFDRGTVEVPRLVAGIAERTGLAPAAVQRVVDGVPRELQPIAATVALVERLHAAGQRLFFLSNMPLPYARHLEATHGFIGRCFERGVFSADVQLIKPEPAIFERAAREFGLEPAQIVFFDDHAPNVAAARERGWDARLFSNAAAAAAELRRDGWPA
jgi:putative hydrolase of the HAD superfamily